MSSNKEQEQFIRGFLLAKEITGKSMRQACLHANVADRTMSRFMTKRSDLKFRTLCKVCEDGFGLPFETVYAMGAKGK